jgi:hypothetical protein
MSSTGNRGESSEFLSDGAGLLPLKAVGGETSSSLGKRGNTAKPKVQAAKRAGPSDKGKASAEDGLPQFAGPNAKAPRAPMASSGKGGSGKKGPSFSAAATSQGGGAEKMTDGLDAGDLGSSSTTRLGAEEEDEADGKAMDDVEDWEWIANEPCTNQGSLCWLGIPPCRIRFTHIFSHILLDKCIMAHNERKNTHPMTLARAMSAHAL